MGEWSDFQGERSMVGRELELRPQKVRPMEKLRILVVDDEEPARLRLKRLLEKHAEQVTVVGEACDGSGGLSEFRRLRPEVVFLDVQMPAPNGLEVAAELADETHPPWIVFLTAFAEHAVKAFELKAMDYLVKPVSPQRLQDTIERLLAQQKDPEDWKEAVSEALQKVVPGAPPLERVALLDPQTENRTVVPLERIDVFLSREEKSYARFEGREYLLQTTLARLEGSLPAHLFFRSHRCYIVNVKRIVQVIPWFNGAYNLKMPDGTEVPLTRRKVGPFKEKVEWL